MTSASNKQILVIGLKSGPDPSADAGYWSAEQVLEAVNTQIELAKHAGFKITNHQIDTNKSYDVLVDEARTILRRQHWDGVSIGYGVRGTESLTPLFEHLVNAIVEDVRPPPRFIFALRPDKVWEAISRVFGVQQAN